MDWLILALLLGQQASAPSGDAMAADATHFSQAVAMCAPASFNTPHPLMPSFQIAHRVEGERDGACHYTQTMPGDMQMECNFSKTGREAFAAEFVALAAGRISGSSGQKPAWADDCEIVMKDGKRLPAFGTMRTK